MGWKYLADVQGTPTVTLPSSFREVSFYFHLNESTWVDVLKLNFSYEEVHSTSGLVRYANTGYYANPSTNCMVRIEIDPTYNTVRLNNVVLNGVDITASARMWVYYR